MKAHASIAVIGGGAAGLAAAIFAAEATGPTTRLLVLDGAKKLGAKILVAGGGRCNVTHHRVTADDYFGPGPVVRNVLRSFDVPPTVQWFETMGVALKREPTGKLFPATDSAKTVLDALLRRCDALAVERWTDCRVERIEPLADDSAPGFNITHRQGTLRADRLIIATGGRSLPRTGSDGAGYAMIEALGHTVTPTRPALVPLVLADDFFHAALSGISHDAELTTMVDGRRADRRTGAMLWTHFGVTGPLIMDASRVYTTARAERRPVELRLNLLPGKAFDEADRKLRPDGPGRSPHAVGRLAEHLPRRLAEQLLHHVGVAGDARLDQLAKADRRALAHALVGLTLPVVGNRGWNHAEVTAGGVPLNEVDPKTLASRRCPGLFLVGEILDCDGRIGGFNFQWAWATGRLAGRAAAASLHETV